MADVVDAPAPAATTNNVEEPTQSTDVVAEPAVAEAKPAEGGVVATSGVAEGRFRSRLACHANSDTRIQLVPATEAPSDADAAAIETKPTDPAPETKTEDDKGE
jgi:hypothetical protein